ncbi:hypothetical protein GUJ93_ZPchr0006g42105 [Zizania palustris]|uniref:DUF1677 family protein n=1 Tax=Zizania palustris TaxID=103762 RepID=A0A8J5S7I0_ZIZPA|nr:hypothetical protein GUJ93_ZPchr0006g42105 [Zizania palustris]
MAPKGEASSSAVAAVALFLATLISNVGHGNDKRRQMTPSWHKLHELHAADDGHKEVELPMTASSGGDGDDHLGVAASSDHQQMQVVVVEAECECCGMSEECTPAYISSVRRRFSGRWVCGLCAEAVDEEAGKNGGELEAALAAHMAVCKRFNGFGRTHPALFHADAMRDILRKLSNSPGSPKPSSTGRRDLTTQGAMKATGAVTVAGGMVIN